MTYKVGDRVTRQIVIGEPSRKHGTVTMVYKSKQSFSSPPIILHSVKWDAQWGGHITEGHFAEGLEREEKVVA